MLSEFKTSYHTACCKKIFGQKEPTELPYSEAQMEDLAKQVIRSQMSVTGVQPKLSLEISNHDEPNKGKRFTIVGLFGSYILKPPTALYPQLPEVEEMCIPHAEIERYLTCKSKSASI